MRVKKDPKARLRMCTRLVELIDTIYGNDVEVARIMGYANSSPLYRVRKKAAFPDVERLERLVKAAPAPGVVVNLNWIVAGDGEPLWRTTRGTPDGMSLGEFVNRFRISRV